MRLLQTASLLATLLLTTPTYAQTATLKMMPLGDSITEFGCWRAYLWDKLAKAGVKNIDWVGSMTDSKTCNGVSTWDRNHEGHAGYLAINIANTNLPTWWKNTPAEIVFFHLGTNDVNGNRATNDIIAAYGKMVDIMRTTKPNVKVIVSQIIPLPSKNQPIIALNNAIPSWVQSKNTAASPVTYVDCYKGWSSADLKDGVHPNEQGDRKMVECLYPEVLRVIQSSQNSTSTRPTKRGVQFEG